ncbi:MAG: hypothetical protein DPW18_14660 [Chloroflexi bacterium]|nr:hypothetical protein [Chloroflexota bacterium]MDL1942091.1 hypothetical protein [Chloroflexi bacterium CFX2]
MKNKTSYRWRAAALTALLIFFANVIPAKAAPAQIPSAFSKVSPANGATGITASSVTLSWDISAQAILYDVCLSTDSALGTCAYSANTGDNSVTFTGLTAGTTYYWQVVAEDWEGTPRPASGGIWSFVTGAPPAAFSKTSPAYGATNQPLSGNNYLQWAASSGASYYQMCISSTSGECSAGGDGTWHGNATGTTWMMNNLSPNTTYYWQIRAVNSYGTTYANNGLEWIFTTRANSAPTYMYLNPGMVTENSSIGSEASAFVVNDPDSGDTFTFALVSGDGSTDNGSFSISGNKLIVQTTIDFEVKNSYSIRVRATDSGGATYERAMTLIVANVAESLPHNFSKTSPENGATGLPLTNVWLNWNSTTEAEYYGWCYSTVAGACTNGTATWHGGPSYSSPGHSLPTLQPNTTYYWQARAGNSLGYTYADSGTEWSFTTRGNSAPTNITLSNSSIAENTPPDTNIGFFSAADSDANDYHNFSLVSGAGDTDNAFFLIDENNLYSPYSFDYETKSSYSIRVRVTDLGGATFEKVFIVSVTNVDEPGDPVIVRKTFTSAASYDGYVLETAETTNTGGALNSSGRTLLLGDDASNRQYRVILSFDTSSLPDNAVITSVTLKFKHAGIAGTNPLNTHGNILVDIRRGAFSNNPALQSADFKVKAHRNGAMFFDAPPVNRWYVKSLYGGYFPFIHKSGITQFRLRFSRDDNNDNGADILRIFSGSVSASARPQLVIEYYMP